MNIAITPTAETLIQQLVELGYDDPEVIIEQALQYFYSQQLLDTSAGFSEISETQLIRENEQRWEHFKKNQNGIPQSEVEARFFSKGQ